MRKIIWRWSQIPTRILVRGRCARLVGGGPGQPLLYYGHGMTDYDVEAVDRLPFATPEKANRYRTENYHGAMGLNWYRTDPTLHLAMAYYLRPGELAFAEPHLTRIGELM